MRHHARTLARPAVALAAVAGLGLLALPSAADETAGGGATFAIDWYTVDGGGGTSTGGDFTLSATAGQPDAGQSAGGPWTVSGGFWAGGAAPPPPPCPPDVDGSGQVDFNDLLSVLNAFGTCSGCPQDIDGNGVVDFTDLLNVLNGFGPCP